MGSEYFFARQQTTDHFACAGGNFWKFLSTELLYKGLNFSVKACTSVTMLTV